MTRQPIRRSISKRQSVSCFEALETRRLLANITWVNEGNDNFGIYGANAQVARGIVQKAISDWERVILDFNYDDTGPDLSNTFNLTVNAADLGGQARGGENNTGRDDATDRKPTSSTVTLDDNGGGAGWYFDPNIFDDGEYSNPIDLFTANIGSGGPTASDFYRTVVHEVGHAMGISLDSDLKLSTIALNTGIADPPSPTNTLFSLNTFGGPDPEYTLTNSGGAHLWEGDGAGGINLPEHPNDLLNAGRTVPTGANRRQLISDIDALLLLDVYNYTIKAPSQINTFAANVNETTGVLTINGNLVFTAQSVPANVPNDIIDLEWSGGITLTVQLTNGSVSSEQIFESSFSTMVVNTGVGDDTVEINGLPPGKSVTVSLGIGDDTATFGGEGAYMTSIASNVTVNGEAGSNNVIFSDELAPAGALWTVEAGSTRRGSARTFFLNGIQSQLIQSSNFHDNFVVNGTAPGTTLTMDGNAGNEVFRLGAGNLATQLLGGPITVNGDVGTDYIELHDYADTPGNDVWTFNAGSVLKAGAPQVNYVAMEFITATAGVQNDVFNVNAAAPTLYLDGGFGNDTFNVGNGDLNALTRVGVIGSVDDDMLVINDFADSGADTYNITAGLITKPGAPGAFQAIEINTQGGLETERTILRANVSDNLIYVAGGRGLELQGGGGADTFQIVDHVAGLPVVIEGGAGLDRVLLNDDNVGAVSAVFNGTQDLAELDLFGGSSLSVAPGTNSIIDVSSFMLLASNSLLDINDNTMIFRAAASAGNVAYFRSRLASAFNGNTWNGTNGITSTTARLSALADGIGFGTATQLARTSINGIAISGNDIVLDHTIYGDVNLDHLVNLADFNRLAANFGQAGRVWAQGDFNYDGSTALPDFNILAGTFGNALSPTAGNDDPDSPLAELT